MRSISSSLDWLLQSIGAKHTAQSHRKPLNKHKHKQEDVLDGIAVTNFEMCDFTPLEKTIKYYIEGLQNDIDTEKLISSLRPPKKPLP